MVDQDDGFYYEGGGEEIERDENGEFSQKRFEWTIIDFTEKEMKFFVNFTNPQAISSQSNARDFMSIYFVETDSFLICKESEMAKLHRL